MGKSKQLYIEIKYIPDLHTLLSVIQMKFPKIVTSTIGATIIGG